MRFFRLGLKSGLFSAALFAMVMAVSATPSVAAEITIKDAYSFAVPEGARNAAAFMTITYPVNAADQEQIVVPDRILRAESSIAEKVEIHTMQIENDVMQMRRLDTIPLPPTGSFKLTPQGVHVMFLGLNRPLKSGDSFPLVMVFEKAGEIETTVAIRAAGDMPEEHGNYLHSDHSYDQGAIAEPAEEKAVHDDVMPHMQHP